MTVSKQLLEAGEAWQARQSRAPIRRGARQQLHSGGDTLYSKKDKESEWIDEFRGGRGNLNTAIGGHSAT